MIAMDLLVFKQGDNMMTSFKSTNWIKPLVVALCLLIIIFSSDTASGYPTQDPVSVIKTIQSVTEVDERNVEKVCIREEIRKTSSKGYIQKTTDTVFGSTEGFVGAVIGGVVGKELTDHDVGAVFGTVIGNKIGNDRNEDKDVKCYEIVR